MSRFAHALSKQSMLLNKKKTSCLTDFAYFKYPIVYAEIRNYSNAQRGSPKFSPQYDPTPKKRVKKKFLKPEYAISNANLGLKQYLLLT